MEKSSEIFNTSEYLQITEWYKVGVVESLRNLLSELFSLKN